VGDSVDLNLLIANLRLTPAERAAKIRAAKIHAAGVAAQRIRGVARLRES